MQRATRKLLQNGYIAFWGVIKPEQQVPGPLEPEGRHEQHDGWIEHNYLVKVRLLTWGARIVLYFLTQRHVMTVMAVGTAARSLGHEEDAGG